MTKLIKETTFGELATNTEGIKRTEVSFSYRGKKYTAEVCDSNNTGMALVNEFYAEGTYKELKSAKIKDIENEILTAYKAIVNTVKVAEEFKQLEEATAEQPEEQPQEEVNFNHEVKCMNDLESRFVNIVAHGGWFNNPKVTMLSRYSSCLGFIKELKYQRDTNKFNLIVENLDYGNTVEIPYEKIDSMTILSSKEQAGYYFREKQGFFDDAEKFEKFITEQEQLLNEVAKDNSEIAIHLEELIQAHKESFKIHVEMKKEKPSNWYYPKYDNRGTEA